MLGAWNLAAPGAVRAVDPSPEPSIPAVSPAPVPGVDCALYSLIGSDLPPCASPTPRPSPYVLYSSPGPSPSAGSHMYEGSCSFPVTGNDSITGCETGVAVVLYGGDVLSVGFTNGATNGQDELRNEVWIDGALFAYVMTTVHGETVTFTASPAGAQGDGTPHVVSLAGIVLGGSGGGGAFAGGASFYMDLVTPGAGRPSPSPSPSPSAGGPVWPIPGVNCLTYPLSGSSLPACSSGQFWSEGVNCVLFPLVAGLPGADLPVCPARPIVPGVDCAVYPLVGGEMAPCPTAMPSPGDCVMYGLTGSDAPVCPEGFPAVPWRHEWPISGLSCPVAKWGFQPYDRTPICAFPGLTLNLGDYMSWLGCMVGVILTTLVNAIRWGINSLIDMLSPCPPVIAATLARFGDSFQQGPFAMVAGTVHALQSGVSGGPGIPYGSFTLYGHTYTLPLMAIAHAAAPIRPYLMPIVAFGVALRALGMFATAVKGPGPTGDEGGGKK
jgi:hypothetical protein